MQWTWRSLPHRRRERVEKKMKRLLEKAERLQKWNRWFAWYPVWVNKPKEPRKYAWFEWVERSYVCDVKTTETFLLERTKVYLKRYEVYYRTLTTAFNQRIGAAED
jgi:hypothetical protein